MKDWYGASWRWAMAPPRLKPQINCWLDRSAEALRHPQALPHSHALPHSQALAHPQALQHSQVLPHSQALRHPQALHPKSLGRCEVPGRPNSASLAVYRRGLRSRGGRGVRPSTLVFLVLLFASLNGFSLDREAFSIANYDLKLQVDPDQHRLGVRGRVTLRNDRKTTQAIAVLQISSSLDWRSVRVGDKAVQMVRQPFASDIDHTGALSEAIVTLPQAVAPQGTMDLDIAYEGVITLDGTRLTRIGTPEDAAESTDWDRIDAKFSAVRGAGYVAWYPIATEVANLSEGDSLFEVLAKWKAREAGVLMKIAFPDANFAVDDPPSTMLCSGDGMQVVTREGTAKVPGAWCSYADVGHSAPSFAIAKYGVVDRLSITVYNLSTHAAAAEAYADAAEKVGPIIREWFGAPRIKARTADLPDAKTAPFESGSLLFTPLAGIDSKLAGLSAAHQLTHAAFSSPRPWIDEGLAHFAQALYLEHESNRQAALDYMGVHRAAFLAAEKDTDPSEEASRALVSTTSEELYRSKAMCVWWMLRDMIGDEALQKAIASYRPEKDAVASYMPRLIAAQTQRDLGWFFDDWVYHDRGLPDFKVESAFSARTATGSFIVTITVDNLGAAGAEVPVTVKFTGGESTKRLEVRGKNKATIRVEVPGAPQEVVVNDGSVPESDVTNNVFRFEK